MSLAQELYQSLVQAFKKSGELIPSWEEMSQEFKDGFESEVNDGLEKLGMVESSRSKEESVSEEKTHCPFCNDCFDPAELPENFAFKEVKSCNTSGWLCCSLCETPITELEDLDCYAR